MTGEEHSDSYFYLLFNYVCMGVLHGCLGTLFVSGTHRSQKRRWNSLELELQIVVKCHMVLELKPGSSGEIPSSFNC